MKRELLDCVNRLAEGSAYQEDIVRLFHEVCGHTFEESHQMRKLVLKERYDELARFKDSTIEALIRNGIDAETADNVWNGLNVAWKEFPIKSHLDALETLSE